MNILGTGENISKVQVVLWHCYLRNKVRGGLKSSQAVISHNDKDTGEKGKKFQRWFEGRLNRTEKCQRGLVNSVRFFILINKSDRNAINYNRERQMDGQEAHEKMLNITNY